MYEQYFHPSCEFQVPLGDSFLFSKMDVFNILRNQIVSRENTKHTGALFFHSTELSLIIQRIIDILFKEFWELLSFNMIAFLEAFCDQNNFLYQRFKIKFIIQITYANRMLFHFSFVLSDTEKKSQYEAVFLLNCQIMLAPITHSK